MKEIDGYVDHIIYRNAENGYTVLSLSVDYGEETLIGVFRSIDEGERIVARGEFIKHPAYGEQFKVEEYEIRELDDARSMERYLSSGVIKGIGEKLAKRIVAEFGDETFRIMDEQPLRLVEIKGISKRIAEDIATQFEEKRGMRKAMVFLQEYGISMNMSVKIYNRYGVKLFEILRENPYKLTEDIEGIGFYKADEIAQKIGIDKESEYRVKSGILYSLSLALSEGHTYLPKEKLCENAASLLNVDYSIIESQISNLSVDKKVIIRQENVYSTIAYYTELNVARMLVDLNISMSENEERLKKIVTKMSEESDLMVDDDQVNAVIGSVVNGVSVITGGPGTGKTTIIKLLLKYFSDESLDILLCAPTGRAAKRMSETTGYEARTIHRMLEIGAEGKSEFSRDETNPLEADVVIVDEMSMVDIFLFHSLLRAIPVGSRLIMVGDVNQLPSVGAGAVLKDIINSNVFSVSTLKHIFRQAAKSDIVLNAHKVNNGEIIKLDNNSEDFFFLERNDAQIILPSIEYLVTKKLPGYVNAEPFEIQVLTPMRKGSLGVENLNKFLQQQLNPPARDKSEYSSGDFLVRQGDKVMQIKNNYQIEWCIRGKYGIEIDKGLGVFNGDMGVVKSIDYASETITVEYEDKKSVDYQFSQADELELAYAVTVHKSQGSEYPAVVIPILNGPSMLMSRNLLYTAITRAKKCVMLIGSSEKIVEVINNSREQTRYTGLLNQIKEMNV